MKVTHCIQQSVVNYYVSNSGSINNDGLQPSRAVTFAGISNLDLSRPCILNFNRGETFNQALSISGPDITMDSYGSGANPLFTGSTDISGLVWTNEGNGTYSTPMTEPNMIYINGLRAALSETAWITITSYPATDKLGINNADVPYASIVGARAAVWLRTWTTEYLYRVTAYSASVMTLSDSTVSQTSVIGERVKLFGKKDFPMLANGWAWDTGKLYIKTAVSPATMDIRMSNFNIGISTSGASTDALIRNVDFKDYYYSAIKSVDCKRTRVLSSTIQNCTGYAISILGVPDSMTVSGCTIFNCDGGIYDRTAQHSFVQYNTIYNIGMGFNVGSIVDPDLGAAPNKGIYLRDNFTSSPQMIHRNGDVSYNTVYNIASTGIQLQSDMVCHHNIVHDFMQLFSDGAGIYSVANNNSTSTNRSEIYNNLIYGTFTYGNAGIYCDAGTVSFYIHHNTIYNVADFAGVNVNNDTQFTRVEDNIFVDCFYSVRFRQNDAIDNHYLYNRGNKILRNIFALRSASQYCHQAEVFDSTVNYNPFGNGGSSDNNYYISPYTTRIGYHSSDTSMTFAELKTRYSTDAASSARVNYKTYANQAQAEIDVLLLTNPTATPVIVSVGAGYIDVDGNTITQATVPAYGGYVALKS